MAISTTINYDNAANFTISDSSKLEISGTVARLKAQTLPTDGTFHAHYTNNINGSWGDGVLTGTATGGASVSGGKLDLKGSTLQYVDYDADDNADSQQVGTVRLLFTPNYSGIPADFSHMVNIITAHNVRPNRISLYHRSTSGDLEWEIRDKDDGIVFVHTALSGWLPVSGVSYEIEINWDLTGGVNNLYLDGVRQGTTNTDTGIRDITGGLLRIGTNFGATGTSNFEIDDLIVFSTVQHTAATYTPGESIPVLYFADNPTIETATAQAVDGVETLVIVDTVSGSDLVKFTLTVDGVDKYWTGAAWATADGTFAQSNTEAEMNTNVSSLDLSAGANVKWKAFLHSEDSSSRPTITSLTYTYDFFVTAPTALQECVVYGTLIDPEGEGISGATVEAIVKTDIFNGGFQVMKSQGDTTTNSVGYWELSLVETVTVGGKITIRFETVDTVNGGKFTEIDIGIPNQVSAAFTDLI